MTERTAGIQIWKGRDQFWSFGGTDGDLDGPGAAFGGGKSSELLPDWLYHTEEIDVLQGLRFCGSAETYLDTLKIYAKTSASFADEIEGCHAAGDIANVAVKVHALKSTSRAVGAEEIGALAEKLEMAGKAGDKQTLDAELPALLERFRALGAALAPLGAGEEAPENAGAALPLISDDELREAYDGLRELAANLDSDNAKYVLNYLAGFRIPDCERERVEKLRAAIEGFDWDRIDEILKTD